MNDAEPFILPKALLFDMDGTLTRPLLDFARIRAEIGVPPGRPILEFIAHMDEPLRSNAQAILDHHEEIAAEQSTLNEGAIALLDWARRRQIGTALITRNSRQSVQTVLRLHRLRLDMIISREDGPIKPDPRPLLMACDRLGAGYDDAWMIGDGSHDIEAANAARLTPRALRGTRWGDGSHDIEAANAAGIRSVWISHRQSRGFAAHPWKTAEGLLEVMSWLESFDD
jgi:HAD superfamily hydrolase (TIGR01549 family)